MTSADLAALREQLMQHEGLKLRSGDVVSQCEIETRHLHDLVCGCVAFYEISSKADNDDVSSYIPKSRIDAINGSTVIAHPASVQCQRDAEHWADIWYHDICAAQCEWHAELFGAMATAVEKFLAVMAFVTRSREFGYSLFVFALSDSDTGFVFDVVGAILCVCASLASTIVRAVFVKVGDRFCGLAPSTQSLIAAQMA